MDEATKLLRDCVESLEYVNTLGPGEYQSPIVGWGVRAERIKAARAYLQAPAAEAPPDALTDEDRAAMNEADIAYGSQKPGEPYVERHVYQFLAGKRAAQVPPREPTQEMICAGLAECELDLNKNLISLPRRIWGAMYDAAPPAPPDQPEPQMTDAVFKAAVDRFLAWPLPETFGPDCGISFDGRGKDARGFDKGWPIGTNLFTADEARAMFEYCLDAAKPPDQARVAPPTLTFTLTEATALLATFGGEDTEVTVRQLPEGAVKDDPADPVGEISPAGLWAHYAEMPEEGCTYLGPCEVQDAIAAQQQNQGERDERYRA